MAFVFRAERKFDTAKVPIQVGPGSYDVENKQETSLPKAYVPFNSMEPRAKPSKPLETTPGPGTYNIAKKNEQEKVVVENATEDIKILEITKPNATFKSNTKRFNEANSSGPGPSDYFKEAKERRIRKQSQHESSKPKIIEHLIKINKYQSIPSIPSNVHAFGYYQNEENQLQLNEPPIETKTGKKNDSVGPGQYNLATESRPKGCSWKEDRTVKLPVFGGNPSVGPGTYEIRDNNPLYSYKPSVSFVSNTQRVGEPKRSAMPSKYTDRPKAFSESQVMSEKAPQSTHIDSSDDEYEYLEDATPGPGAYLNLDSAAIKTRKPVKASHFGSTSKRFNDLPSIRHHIVGPGQYNIDLQKKVWSLQKRKAPFNSGIQRFTKQENPRTLMPGPGSYEPRNALEDQLIFKIQRGYRGQFGSTEQRFKDGRSINEVGPGSYDVPSNGVVEVEIETSGTASFKSKVKKEAFSKNLNPPPGSYNVDYFDICKNAIKEEDDDPDLVIRKPGFNSGVERFKKEVVKDDLYDDQDLLNEIHGKVQQEQRRNKPNMAPFNSHQPRLTEVRRDIPGPGEYEMNGDEWNKRTYNILFADI